MLWLTAFCSPQQRQRPPQIRRAGRLLFANVLGPELRFLRMQAGQLSREKDRLGLAAPAVEVFHARRNAVEDLDGDKRVFGDDPLRDRLAADDIDLGRDVAGEKLLRIGRVRKRVRPHFDDDRRGRGVHARHEQGELLAARR